MFACHRGAGAVCVVCTGAVCAVRCASIVACASLRAHRCVRTCALASVLARFLRTLRARLRAALVEFELVCVCFATVAGHRQRRRRRRRRRWRRRQGVLGRCSDGGGHPSRRQVGARRPSDGGRELRRQQWRSRHVDRASALWRGRVCHAARHLHGSGGRRGLLGRQFVLPSLGHPRLRGGPFPVWEKLPQVL